MNGEAGGTAAAPIGVFDSGVGGLSVLQALQAAWPGESFVYVADSGHAPYGEREAGFIESRTDAVAGYLVERGAKALVLACNTASVVAARRLRARHALPIVAMEPAIKPAAALTRSKVVLVLATDATIASPSVARLCEAHGHGIRILLQACPGLAEQIEHGRLQDAGTRALLERFLAPGLAAGADTIVLGCTHYAFLRAQIGALAGPGVTLLEPSAAIAQQLGRRLGLTMASTTTLPALPSATRYLTSGSPPALARFLASIGLPHARVEPLTP